MIIPDLAPEAYHAHPAIGSTTAKLMLKSKQLFRDAITGDYRVKDSAAFVSGRLLHLAALEPEKFAALTTTTGPINPKTGLPFGRESKAFAEWQADHPQITVIDEWIGRSISRCPAAVLEILTAPGEAEASVIRDTGLSFEAKARPDWWVDRRCIYDLKSCKDIDQAERDVAKFHYWFSEGWYRAWCKDETGQTQDFAWIFAEKHPPFRWRIVRPDACYRMYSDDQVERILAALADGYRTGDWGDPDETDTTISPPDWMTQDDDEEEE